MKSTNQPTTLLALMGCPEERAAYHMDNAYPTLGQVLAMLDGDILAKVPEYHRHSLLDSIAVLHGQTNNLLNKSRTEYEHAAAEIAKSNLMFSFVAYVHGLAR